jgi:hypothetical protein
MANALLPSFAVFRAADHSLKMVVRLAKVVNGGGK